MPDETLTPQPNLLDNLQPLLNIVKELDGDRHAQSSAVREWFEEHPQNLAIDVEDLSLVCTLPGDKRYLFTYPIVGNWILGEIAKFVPNSEHQQLVIAKTREIIELDRFANGHWDMKPEDKMSLSRMYDELNALMLSNPDDSSPVVSLIRNIIIDVSDGIESLPMRNDYTTDLGHGLIGPVNHFWIGTTWQFEQEAAEGKVDPIDAAIMVVDDQDSEDWYRRLIAAGFKNIPDQEGHFSDPAIALEALRKGSYDVVLTDLDLGEGQMSGVEFARSAFAIQQAKGIKGPLISAFSYDDELLKDADKRIGRSGREQPVFFHQVTFNNKVGFTGFHFGMDVRHEIDYRNRHPELFQ